MGDQSMIRFAAVLLAFASTAALAANPVAEPTKLDPKWQAKTRALFEQVVELPTVISRGNVPKMAAIIADQLKAAGFPADDVKIIEHEGLPGDKTATLIARWRADKPNKKTLMILRHMDAVRGKREDWKFDPFEFRE